MKNMLLIGVMSLAVPQFLRAQTFDEWFEQKKTQISYLYKQITALEAYRQVTEKGYQIVQEGTQLITDTKTGDFDLHSQYFSSLLNVNPSIRKYPKVGIILNLSAQIPPISGQAGQMAAAIPAWAPTISAFYDGLLKACGEDLDALKTLTTDGAISMTDDQRVGAIDGLYDRMKKRLDDAIRARNDIVSLLSNY